MTQITLVFLKFKGIIVVVNLLKLFLD